MKLARNLTILMYDRKVKTQDLAEVVGVKPSTISKFKAGTLMPKLETTAKIAKFFDITIDELIG